jgi:hypothetical protein
MTRSSEVIKYAEEKAKTENQYFCAHDVADKLQIPNNVASWTISALEKRKVLMSCGSKDKCKTSGKLHTFYCFHTAYGREDKTNESEKMDYKIKVDALPIKIPSIVEFERRIKQQMNPLPVDVSILILKEIVRKWENDT